LSVADAVEEAVEMVVLTVELRRTRGGCLGRKVQIIKDGKGLPRLAGRERLKGDNVGGT